MRVKCELLGSESSGGSYRPYITNSIRQSHVRVLRSVCWSRSGERSSTVLRSLVKIHSSGEKDQEEKHAQLPVRGTGLQQSLGVDRHLQQPRPSKVRTQCRYKKEASQNRGGTPSSFLTPKARLRGCEGHVMAERQEKTKRCREALFKAQSKGKHRRRILNRRLS